MKRAVTILFCIFMAGPLWALAATATSSQKGSSTNAALSLPYGVEDVLKLSRAEVSDDIIVKYIRNSGTIYSLAPETIVYLKDQGVNDAVVKAMLDQPKRQAGTTSTWTSLAPAQTPQQQPAPTYTQAPQADPVPPAPKSTLHIIPYYPATYSYYYGPSWPGYYSRPYWSGPSISLGFGFGFGHHHHYRSSFGFRCW